MPGPLKWDMRGAKEMTGKMKKIARLYPDHLGGAMFAEAGVEVTEMKKRCPVDTRPNRWYPYTVAPHPGQLRNSIHAEEPTTRGRTIVVIIATGAEAPYAVYVHEDPDAFHPVGEWQFMASVLRESQPTMGRRIARRAHFDKMRV